MAERLNRRTGGRRCPVCVVIEGIDGSGKSTLALRMVVELNALGRSAMLLPTTTPGECPAGRLLRLGLLGDRRPWFGVALRPEIPRCLAYMANARFWARRTLRAQPEIVVGDRSTLTFAALFPTLFRGRHLYGAAVRWITGLPIADALLYLDTDIAIATERIRSRGTVAGNETPSRLLEVSRRYDTMLGDGALVRRWGVRRTMRISGNRPAAEVLDDAMSSLRPMLQNMRVLSTGRRC